MRIGYFDMEGNLAMLSALNHVHFSALGKDYTAVCGMVEGYQYGSMDAFQHLTPSKTPDELYAEGISITHGSSPRRHLMDPPLSGRT